jgi:colicin import membrane protein
MMLSFRHVGFAVLLHAALFLLLFTGIECTPKVEEPQVIQGVMVNPAQLAGAELGPVAHENPQREESNPPVQSQQIEQQAQEAQKQQEQEAARQQAQHDEEVRQQQEAAAAEAQKQKEDADRQAELVKQQQAEEAQRQAEEAQKQAAAAQAEALKKQQQAAAAQKAAEERKAQEAAEAQRQIAAEEEEQKRAALDAKKKKEAAARAAAQRKQAQDELQQELGVEEASSKSVTISDWQTQLTAAIKRNFFLPPGTDSSMKSYLKITLSTSGEVLSANVATTSGSLIFDESVKSAVVKASPLPLPRDPSVFDPNITICFSPEPRNCQSQ